MKKSLFVLVFALVLVMAVSGSAFALHSGYDATTGSCRSCHAVHNATGDHLYNSNGSRGGSGPGVYSGVKITLSTASVAQNLCEWCHVYGTSHAVYQTGLKISAASTSTFAMGMHEIGATNTVDAGTAGSPWATANAAGLDCIDCHNAMPHAAGTNVNVAFYVKDAGATEAAVVNAMCVRCHEANSATHVGTTHPLVAAVDDQFATSNYGTLQVAFQDSADCLSCHNYAGGVHSAFAPKMVNGAIDQATLLLGSITSTTTYVDTIATNSTGWKFTNFGIAGARGYGFATATATTAPILTGTGLKVQDTECLSCHESGVSGVGQTF